MCMRRFWTAYTGIKTTEMTDGSFVHVLSDIKQLFPDSFTSNQIDFTVGPGSGYDIMRLRVDTEYSGRDFFITFAEYPV